MIQSGSSRPEIQTYVVLLKPEADKSAHLSWLSKLNRRSSAGMHIRVDEDSLWNGHLTNGYVVDLNIKAKKAVEKRVDVDNVMEDLPLID